MNINITLSQAEQQRLTEIIRQDLADLEYRSDGLREMIRTVAANAANLGWNEKMKRNLQKPCHNEIKKINEKIAKRSSLLKKIKQA
jgi:hypothetical protein